MMRANNVEPTLLLLIMVMFFLTPPSTRAQFSKKLKMNFDNKVLNAVNTTTAEFLKDKKDNVLTGPIAISPPVSEVNNPLNYKTSKSLEVADQEQELLRYNAPSADFRDVVIQAHNGLPRYGELQFNRDLHKLLTLKAYQALLELRFLEETFKNLDRTKLTKHPSYARDLEIKNSEFAQNHLLTLARETLSDTKLQEYFCDANAKTPCNFYNPSGERSHISYWGGTSNNEFAQNRNFSNFTKNYFEILKNWSQTFYKDGNEVAYYVTKGLVAEKYDFSEKGYWIGNLFSIGGDFVLHHTNFLAYTENERGIRHQRKKIFLPMNADKAEAYNLIPRAPVFILFKVIVSPNPINNRNVVWEFELESSIIEIYKDPALTDKMGEIDINLAKLKD